MSAEPSAHTSHFGMEQEAGIGFDREVEARGLGIRDFSIEVGSASTQRKGRLHQITQRVSAAYAKRRQAKAIRGVPRRDEHRLWL